jgi:lipopolysaccharide transport system ATP-binding protein
MSDIAIRVENLSKLYRISRAQQRHDTLRDALVANVRAPLRRLSSFVLRPSSDGDERRKTDDEFIWALKDVSFEVKRGEVVGIIGRNGAGKSTLLKILSRITKPTEGWADVYGRMGTLLEVGTGFHGELSGRENIYLSGAIMGMSKAEIDRKFDEIVAFAEVEKLIDTPVKHYSSGMYVRLAFAVAAHLEPEILLVDEVLAVGDAAFQKKCLGKMGDVAREGRTVLFVSHNMAAVNSLCERAVLLEAGRVVIDSIALEVVEIYLQGGEQASTERVWENSETAPGNWKARIRRVRVQNSDSKLANQLDTEDPVSIEIDYQNLEPNTELNVAIALFNSEGVRVLVSVPATDPWFQKPHPAGYFRSRCIIPGGLLNQGRYSLAVLLVENGQNVIAELDRVVNFDIADLGAGRGSYFGHWGGVVRPNLPWKTEILEPTMSHTDSILTTGTC